MSLARSRLLLATVIAIVSGCTLYDERELEVVVLDQDAVAETLTIRIDASRGIDEAVVAIDGRRVGRLRTNQQLGLDISGLPEGEHEIRVEAEGARPPPPASAPFSTFHVPTEVQSVRPYAGARDPGEILEVEVVFTDPLPAGATQELGFVTWTDSGPGEALATSREGAGDGRSASFRLDADLSTLGDVALVGVYHDRWGKGHLVLAGPWHTRRATVRLVPKTAQRTWPLWTNGTVHLDLVWTSGDQFVGEATVAAGDVVLARMGPAFSSQIAVDTSTLPEGSYELTVANPRFILSYDASQTDLRVDRTPPVATCAPSFSAPGGLESSACLLLETDADVLVADPVYLADGVPQGTGVGPGLAHVQICPRAPFAAPPFEASVDVSGFRDLAGNAAVLEGCRYPVLPWVAPWGDAPFARGGTNVAADSAAVESGLAWDGTSARFERRVTLAWIEKSAADAGDVNVATAFATQLPAAATTLGHDAVSVTAVKDQVAWIERAPASGGDVRHAERSGPGWLFRGPLDVVAEADAAEVVLSSNGGAVFDDAIAWTEAVEGGGRAIRSREACSVFGLFTGDIRSTSIATASAPALAYGRTGRDETGLLAFIETVGSGVPQVRAATLHDVTGFDAWGALDGSLNRDPTLAASEPAACVAGVSTVAWIEDGVVLARVRDGMFGDGTFSAAVELQADATRPARSPRATASASGKPVVVWIETSDAGDEIRASRFDGDAWTRLPGPINAGRVGTVRALAVSPGPVVAWTDGDDAVHVRVGTW